MLNYRKYRVKVLPTAWLRSELAVCSEKELLETVILLTLSYKIIGQTDLADAILLKLRKERAFQIRTLRRIDWLRASATREKAKASKLEVQVGSDQTL